jgi:hypothetical protein
MTHSIEQQGQQECLTNGVADSPLFELPPEIRTMIYRFALVADGELPITKVHGIPEAALLKVSKLVRSETYSLFYRENEFNVIVYDGDCAPLLLSCHKFSGCDRFSNIDLHDHVKCLVENRGDHRNWKNLVIWYRLCAQNLCCGIGPLAEDNAEESLLTGSLR